MGGENEILLHADGNDLAQSAAAAAIEEVRRIERKYSRYRDDSVVAEINRCAGKRSLQVDEETAALIDYAAVAYAQSEGLFDLSSGVLRRAWDFRAPTPRLPSREQVAALLPRVGWAEVAWNRPDLALPEEGWELDLGGIGKEYAADRAAMVLKERGIVHALVNLGGDLCAVGPQPGGMPWRVAIRHPRQDGAILATVPLYAGALASSGDYERYFEIDGRRYCHILDPRTGFPVDHIQAASVIAPLCVVAGSLATIAMLRGDAALPLLQASAESYLLVDREGRVSGNLRR